MDVGLYVRDYMDDPSRPLYDQIEEAAEIFRHAKGMGFTTIYMPQHFIAHPTVWPQPMEVLSRLAPDAEGLRLMTGTALKKSRASATVMASTSLIVLPL